MEEEHCLTGVNLLSVCNFADVPHTCLVRDNVLYCPERATQDAWIRYREIRHGCAGAALCRYRRGKHLGEGSLARSRTYAYASNTNTAICLVRRYIDRNQENKHGLNSIAGLVVGRYQFHRKAVNSR